MISGNEIRTLRESLDLRQFEFGAILGIEPWKRKARIMAYEAEREYPTLAELRHLRTLLAVADSLQPLEEEKSGRARKILEGVFDAA